jgi:hypothetical protein
VVRWVVGKGSQVCAVCGSMSNVANRRRCRVRDWKIGWREICLCIRGSEASRQEFRTCSGFGAMEFNLAGFLWYATKQYFILGPC